MVDKPNLTGPSFKISKFRLFHLLKATMTVSRDIYMDIGQRNQFLGRACFRRPKSIMHFPSSG